MAQDEHTEGPHQPTFITGMVQTLIGFLAVTLFAGIIVVEAPVYLSGIGIWGGAFYIAGGVLPMFAVVRKTRRYCLWSVVINVFVLLIAVAFFAIAAYAIHVLRLDLLDYEIQDAAAHHKITTKCHRILSTEFSGVGMVPYCVDKVIEYSRIGMVLYCLQMLIAGIEFITAVVIIFRCARELKEKEPDFHAPARAGGDVKMVEFDRAGAYPSAHQGQGRYPDDRGQGRYDDRGQGRYDDRDYGRYDDRGQGRYDERDQGRYDDRDYDRRYPDEPHGRPYPDA